MMKNFMTLGLAGLLTVLSSASCMNTREEESYDNDKNLVREESLDDMLNGVYKIYHYAEYVMPQEPDTKMVAKSIGSAVVIKGGDLQYLATCEHVISSQPVIFTQRGLGVFSSSKVCLDINGKEVEVEVAAQNPKYDVAILKTKENLSLKHTVELSDINLREGDQVYAVGHPFNYGKFLTDGIVSSVPDETHFFYSAQIDPGYSGGPVYALLDGKPKIVGLNCFMIRNSNGMFGANHSWCIKKELDKALNPPKKEEEKDVPKDPPLPIPPSVERKIK